MRIGINLLPFKEFSGVEVYTQHLLENLGKLNQKDDFFLFIGKNTPQKLVFNYKNFHYIKTSTDSRKRIKRVLWEQIVFPFYLKKYKIGILFNPTLSGPLFWLGKKNTTIHDCAYDRFREFDSLVSKIYFRVMFYGAKYSNKKIVTVSNFSKKELMKLYKIKPEKIKVIYEGIPQMPGVKQGLIQEVLDKFKIKKPYFLYIGNWRPRKNLSGLIEAFKLFRESSGLDWILVIGGKTDKRFLNLEKEIKENKLEGRVVLTGFVSDDEKSALYKKAKALVFPSFYEGFGLPVLEAQSSGLPVLASKIPALSEVAGSSVLYVDPWNVGEIAQGMERLAREEGLRHKLIKKGFENTKRFSWERTTKQLLNLFHSL